VTTASCGMGGSGVTEDRPPPAADITARLQWLLVMDIHPPFVDR